MITVLLCAVMFVGLFLILRNKKRAEESSKAKISLIIGACMVLLCGGFLLHRSGTLSVIGFGKSVSDEVLDEECATFASQAYMIAQHLKQNNRSNARLLLLADETFQTEKKFLAFASMLKKCGFPEENITMVSIFESANPSPAPISTRMSAQDFDAAVTRNAGFDYVISLVGLPGNAMSVSFLRGPYQANAPQLFILASRSMTATAIAGMKRGNVEAVIAVRPGAIYTVDKMPKAQEDIFALRYAFYTRDSETLPQ